MKHHLPGAGHPTQTREEILYTKVNVVLTNIYTGAPQGGREPPPNFRLALLPPPPPPPPRVSHLQLCWCALNTLQG